MDIPRPGRGGADRRRAKQLGDRGSRRRRCLEGFRPRPGIDDTGQYANDAKRYDASQLTRFDPLPVFAEFFAPDRIVEVSNWATSTNDTARSGREYVDSRAEIIGRGGFCAVTRPGVLRAGLGTWCDATTGHQCMQPRGPPTLVARALMLRLRASLGGGGVS